MKYLFLLFYNFLENNIHLRNIKNYLKKNVIIKKPIIFDVGSHKGKLTKLFKNLYNDSTIYCFDPNKSFQKDIKNLGKKIKIYNYALGEKVEKRRILFSELDLTTSLSNLNKHSIYLKIKNLIVKNKSKDSYEMTNVNTLDNFCYKNKIKKIDFLKIDVEGYEYMVLQGAKKIIKDVKYIMIEAQKNDMYENYSRNKIEKFLKKHSFKLEKKFNFPFMFFEDCIYKKK